MKYAVIIHPDAEAEIIDAFRYIHDDSAINARRWLEGLYKTIDTLESMPRRCALARENDAFDTEIRQLVYQSHRVLFTVERRTVHVLHVRHGARRDLHPGTG